MDSDQLAAFQRVVREGSFTRAALSLGIGQPAVSARIKALEDSVGGALFTRGRRVALTPLGEAFLPYARRASDVLDAGLEAARLTRTGQRGRVTLASLNSLAGGLVAPALAKLLAANPAVEYRLLAGNHEHVLGLLWDGLVELGVVVWPTPEAVAGDLIRHFVLRETVHLVVAPDHPLAKKKRVTKDDVARLARPLLRLRWWRTHHPEVERLAERAVTSAQAPMETARPLVIGGLAVGFFPQTYIAEDLAAGRLVVVKVRDLPPIHRDCALVRRPRATPPSPAIAAMTAALKAQALKLGSVR